MVVQNCAVTLSDAEVLKEYIDDGYREKTTVKELHTGVDLKGHYAYSMSIGKVIFIGKSESGTKNVIVKYNTNNCFNYANLTSLAVDYYDEVEVGTQIGQCKGYIHFEHLSIQQTRWPVRIGLDVWYKKDPMYVLENGFLSVDMYPVEAEVTDDFPEFMTQDDEFTGSRGD